MLHHHHLNEFWVPVSLVLECLSFFVALIVMAVMIAALVNR